MVDHVAEVGWVLPGNEGCFKVVPFREFGRANLFEIRLEGNEFVFGSLTDSPGIFGRQFFQKVVRLHRGGVGHGGRKVSKK